MRRLIALTIALIFAVATAAPAQEVREAAPASAIAKAKTGSVFSKSNVQKAVMSVQQAVPAPPRSTKRKFLRGPWPYVIAAGVVAVLVLTLGGSGIPDTD